MLGSRLPMVRRRHTRPGANARPPRQYFNSAEDYEVKSVPTKDGLGLFARHALPMNSRLVYDGRRITKAQYEWLVELDETRADAPKKRYVSYVGGGGLAGVLIDANPRHPGSADWFCGWVNEPSSRESANMLLVSERKPISRTVFVSVRPIAAGAELLVHYGTSYRRRYQVGRAARRPAWL